MTREEDEEDDNYEEIDTQTKDDTISITGTNANLNTTN